MPHKYWTRKDEKDAKAARSYKKLLAVALRVLERMPEPVCFVCGPISTGGAGSKKKNVAVFRQHIAQLKKEGWNVFDQMPFEKALWRLFALYGNNEDKLLDEFYLLLFKSGKLGIFHFIPGWKTSQGATWEHAQARRLDIRKQYLKKLPANRRRGGLTP